MKVNRRKPGALLGDGYFIWSCPGLTEMVICELRPKRNREWTRQMPEGRVFQKERTARQDPEAGVCLAYGRKSKDAGVARRPESTRDAGDG